MVAEVLRGALGVAYPTPETRRMEEREALGSGICSLVRTEGVKAGVTLGAVVRAKGFGSC